MTIGSVRPTRMSVARRIDDVFDIAEHFGLSFPLGNALKYILRHKDETKRLEDLKKARQCLDRAIELMERENNE